MISLVRFYSQQSSFKNLILRHYWIGWFFWQPWSVMRKTDSSCFFDDCLIYTIYVCEFLYFFVVFVFGCHEHHGRNSWTGQLRSERKKVQSHLYICTDDIVRDQIIRDQEHNDWLVLTFFLVLNLVRYCYFPLEFFCFFCDITEFFNGILINTLLML